MKIFIALMAPVRMLWGLLCLSILSGLPVSANAQGGAARQTFNVGYRVIDLAYRQGGQDKSITVAVWYPTSAGPKRYNYGGPTYGNVAPDAEPLKAKGPYPLLVFSHGYGGGGIGSVFFTEALAARGWVVAAPDHHDRDSAVRIRSGQVKGFSRVELLKHACEIADSGPVDRNKYLYRLDEMKAVVDGMISSPLFQYIIDIDRIAVGGHSFGGFTALGLCGTIRQRYDPRIKAVLLFSTGAGSYLFTEDELKRVRVPSMLFMGQREKGQARGKKTMLELEEKIYGEMAPPKYLLEVRDGSHFSFNNRFAGGLRAHLLSGSEEQYEVIRKYSIAFLEKYVAGKRDYDGMLAEQDPMLTRYLRQP